MIQCPGLGSIAYLEQALVKCGSLRRNCSLHTKYHMMRVAVQESDICGAWSLGQQEIVVRTVQTGPTSRQRPRHPALGHTSPGLVIGAQIAG